MLVFIDQATGIGGYSSLVKNIARILNENGLICKIVCSESSFLFKQLHLEKTEFFHIDIEKNNTLQNHIDGNDIIISGLIDLSVLQMLRKINPYFIFYNLAPDILIRIQKYYKFLSKRTFAQLLHELNTKNGLYFMDGSGSDNVLKYFKINDIIPHYLPVCLPKSEINHYNIKNGCNVITYLGRGVNWKIFPVKKLIADLIKVGFVGELHIITDSKDEFIEMLKGLESPTLVIKYIIGLKNQQLSEYLILNSDLNFAMGMSALESAIIGIPTILVDYSYEQFPYDYKYRWLFEDNETYNLGYLINSKVVSKGRSIDKILDLYNNNYSISCISEKCFLYANANHSFETLNNKLLMIIENAGFKVTDFVKYPFYKIFYSELLLKYT